MSAILNQISGGSFTIGGYFLCLLAAFGCGVLAALAAAYHSKVTKSFLVTLILLAPIVHTVITMVNGNVGTGVAVAGAFSLVRFRSVPGKARDMASIFLAMTAGLVCAAGYPVLALLFTCLVCAVMLLLARIPMGEEGTMDLHITVPESLHYAREFEDLFQTYTSSCQLVKTRTSNLGSLYKLEYRVVLKDPAQAQAFIDQLRCRNGNLEISLAESGERSEEL